MKAGRMKKENKNKKNVEVGALWKRRANSNGQIYLSGYVRHGEMEQEETLNVVVFSNNYRNNNDKAPDYRIYLSQPKEEAQEDLGEEKPQQEAQQETQEENIEELI